MRILWLIEDNNTNPNFKISIKVAEILAINHKVYLGLYSSNPDLRSNFQKSSFEDIFYFGEVRTKDLYYNDSVSWKLMDTKRKIIYLLKHPTFWIPILKEKLGQTNYVCVRSISNFCKINNIDIIIGTVFPYKIATFLAGIKFDYVKILFQLDPYVNNETLSDKTKIKRIFKERLIMSYMYKIFTTRIIKNEILQNETCIPDKIVQIEFPEFSEEAMTNEIPQNNFVNAQSKDIFFFHAGTFYRNIRNPKILVSIFEKLPKNYKLILAGTNTKLINEFSYSVKDRIIDLGLISQEDVTRLRESADILISFNNLVDNQIPSKLFECIGTGKPFLNICQIVNCPTIPYVKDYENALTIFTDNIQEKEIINFVEKHLGKKVPKKEILSKYYKHTYEYVARQIEEVFIYE